MLRKTQKVALAILVWCNYAQAAPPCTLTALHERVMTAANVNMGTFVIFRGEVVLIGRPSPAEGACGCSGADCISTQCWTPPASLMAPTRQLDYAVNETIWGVGAAPKPLIHVALEAMSRCGPFNPVLHDKIIAFCSTFSGWPDDGPMYCERPVADTEENLRQVRSWIPAANKLRQREKISEADARTHLIHKTNPVYPQYLRGKTRVTGDVVVRIFINTAGSVESISAISGPQDLRQSVVNAVSLWRYKPFMANGRPLRVDTNMTVHF